MSDSRARPEAKSAPAVKTWVQLGSIRCQIPCKTAILDAGKARRTNKMTFLELSIGCSTIFSPHGERLRN